MSEILTEVLSRGMEVSKEERKEKERREEWKTVGSVYMILRMGERAREEADEVGGRGERLLLAYK